MPPPEGGEISSFSFEDLSHSWYRCQDCRVIVYLAMTLEMRPMQLKRILQGAGEL
jgi:hypothetical protein